MKALALDTSVSCISVAAKNDDKLACLVLDIGMRQSEKLLPAIDYVLKQADLEVSDLDYTALCEGPGSFTGLRLSFAALKAIELFGGKAEEKGLEQKQKSDGGVALKDLSVSSRVPIYGINSLDFLAQPYMDFDGIVLPAIDAHKEKFYAKAFFDNKEIVPCDDWDLSALEQKIEEAAKGLESQKSWPAQRILLCGLEAQALFDACKESGLFKGRKILAPKSRSANMESLFVLAEEKIKNGLPPLADYDGPQYFRASEAEQKAAN